MPDSAPLNWAGVIAQLRAKEVLSNEQTSWAMENILSGSADIEEIKNFLLAYKEKGETPDEISAMVAQMFKFAAPITIPDRALDIVGTGGDGANTINISTTACIVTTAAGARVVKHGNRAATSLAGSADLLEALGIDITLDGVQVAECIRRIGIGFCFAPKFHPAMRFAAPARKELKVPTIFNILGPLSNPAQPKAVAIGVASERMLPIMAKVLADRGCEGFLFRGDDGLDEISISTTTTVIQINDGQMRWESFDPRNIGIELSPISEIVGGDPAFNAAVTRSIFDGEIGPRRDAVLLNAAASIAAFKADFSLSVEQQFANGWVRANQAVDSGAAKRLLQNWIELSQELATTPSA
ncbi:MAG: anthranilate phosphoribosyltransferase [Actinomycetes bacterium]